MKTLIQTSVLLVLFLILYVDALVHIVSKWGTAEGAHGPLIIAVSVYLIWQKKDLLRTLPVRPQVVSGGLILFLSFFALFAGKLSSTIFLQQISMVPALLGGILLLGGVAYFKVLFLPVVYLFFITGLVETILSDFAIYLQIYSAWISVQFFKLIGMPVVLTGTIIDLPHISLEVVRACSGISHLVAIMALSIPLGIMSRLTPLRKIFLIAASFVIGLLANGFRIFLIGVYALYNKGADLHGPNETMAVSVIFFIGMILLIILNHFLKPKKRTDDSEELEDYPAVVNGSGSSDVKKYTFAWLVIWVLFIITLSGIHFYKIEPVPLTSQLDTLAVNIDGFRGKPLMHIDDEIRPFTADAELLRIYEASDVKIDVYVGYFAEQTRERKLIDYRRNWMHEQVQRVTVATTGGNVIINKTRLQDRSNPADVYFWYAMDDRIITNQYVGKLYTFLDGLFKRRTNGAVVVVQTRSNQEEVMPFLEELVPRVMGVLGGQ